MEIGRICSALQIPFVVKCEALNIRKQVGKEDETYFNRNNQYKCAACIKLACRIHDFPLSEKELISLTIGYPEPVDSMDVKIKGSEFKRNIDREFLNLLRKTKLNLQRFKKSPNYISYACGKLGLGPEEEMKIREVYQRDMKYYKKEYGPNGYILALIHIFYGEERGIRLIDIVNKMGVSGTTVSARIRNIKDLWKRRGKDERT